MNKVVVTAVAVFVSAGSAIASAKSSEPPLTSAAQVVQELSSTIPQNVIDKAHCVVVIPSLKKAAFVVGGEHGNGVMSCRTGDTWGAPIYMQLTKGSVGFQAGVSDVALVLLVMNEHGAEKLLKNNVTLGAGASIAAGPVGRQAEVGTDVSMTAEILSYSRAKGVFAGVNLSGGSLRPDSSANDRIYGKDANLNTILASRAPSEATVFIAALPGPSRSMARATPNASQPAPRIETVPEPERRVEPVEPAEPAVPTGTTGVVTEPVHRHPRMPRTASPLALYELIGCLALAGAVGVRCLRSRIG